MICSPLTIQRVSVLKISGNVSSIRDYLFWWRLIPHKQWHSMDSLTMVGKGPLWICWSDSRIINTTLVLREKDNMMIFPTIDQVLMPCCNTQCPLESATCIHLLQNFIKKPKLQKHHAYIGFSAIRLLIHKFDVETDVTIVIMVWNHVRMTVKLSQTDKVTSKPLLGSLLRKACLYSPYNTCIKFSLHEKMCHRKTNPELCEKVGLSNKVGRYFKMGHWSNGW